jgi:hypothetical protein
VAVEGVLGRPGGRGGQAAADLGPRPRPGDGRDHAVQEVRAVSGSRTANGIGWWPRSRSNASLASSTASAPPGPGR